MDFNYTRIISDFVNWSLQGYYIVLGQGLFWCIVFSSIIGYVYLKQQSMIAAAIAALILIAAFGNTIMGVTIWVTLIEILVALAFTTLIVIFLTKIRG